VKRARRAALLACAAALTGAVLAGAALAGAAEPGWQAAEAGVQLKEAPGRELASGRCATCHSLEYIQSNAPAMNRAGWQKSIQKMRERFGAAITDEEAQQLLDYLDGNYSGKST
jgi:sulfite dehydrogenase (cytochrome) subunit B